MIIDVAFRILGKENIPQDHGYALYSAISRLHPILHAADWLAIHPISGFPSQRGLALTPRSRLQLRLPSEKLPAVLPLAGKPLVLSTANGTVRIRLGVPEVYGLKPSSDLHSRCVVIKVSEVEISERNPDREMFLAAVLRQMQSRDIKGEVWIDDRRDAKGRELSRRIVRIKDKTIVGYSVRVSGLKSDDDSIKLQNIGLGGRQRMGCGIFVPLNIK
jgi:CRISPR-associated protein Cas6